MSTARSIPKQLHKKKTSILQLLLFSSSPCSSVKLFSTSTTPQPSFKNGPSFLGCFRKTLIPQQSSFFSSSSSQLLASSHGASYSFTINRGLSSSCYSEVDGNITNNKEDQIASIPIRAYFLSTSIDLESLIYENQVNFIPPTLPVTNHIVLRFTNTNSRPRITDVEASLSGRSYCYLVVFRYGSVITFNIVDHKVDRYLKIIERHASGLPPEMRKDNEVFCQNVISKIRRS